MNTFKNKFLTALNEEDGEGQGINYDRSGDSEILDKTFETEDDARAFDAISPEGEYDADYSERIKEWQGKISEFLGWLNGTDQGGLRKELSDADNAHEGVSKDSEKKISDIAQNLGALKEILVEIPRTINHQDRDASKAEDGMQASVAPNDGETSNYRF